MIFLTESHGDSGEGGGLFWLKASVTANYTRGFLLKVREVTVNLIVVD